MNKLWQKIRRLGVELYSFFTAPFVVKNCLSMILLLTGLFLMTFWWLKCYTNHGESTVVPNYIGMSFRDAVKKARARDYSVVVSDSIFVTGKAPGEIIDQNPKPDSKVKEGRTLYLTVAKVTADLIKLPSLSDGDDYDLYSRKLGRMGINSRIVARVADPRLGPNVIVSVIYRGDTITNRIQRGFTVDMGSTVDFMVSEEVTTTVDIPDCMCKTLDEAKFLIQANELSIGTITPDATVTNQATAFVWRQTPKYDANGIMRKGEQIDLWLTQEKPNNCPKEE